MVNSEAHSPQSLQSSLLQSGKNKLNYPKREKNTLKLEKSSISLIHYKVLTHSVITWAPKMCTHMGCQKSVFTHIPHKKCNHTGCQKSVFTHCLPPKSVITFGCWVPKRPVAGLPHAPDWGEAPATLSIT